MDVVTTRHPLRVTSVGCFTHPPTERAGRRASPGPPEPERSSSAAYPTKRVGARNDDGHLGPVRAEESRKRLVAMTTTLRHRGPDDAGAFLEDDVALALGSRRLAVVDLSLHGHQPMASSDGRYVLAFNGEIYNFRDLRRELEARGVRFRGSGDTEVLVAAVQHWGLREALVRCNGMFGLALWDRSEHRLQLARDRFGEKPLYYGWAGTAFLFGSELKALRAHPGFAAEID